MTIDAEVVEEFIGCDAFPSPAALILVWCGHDDTVSKHTSPACWWVGRILAADHSEESSWHNQGYHDHY